MIDCEQQNVKYHIFMSVPVSGLHIGAGFVVVSDQQKLARPLHVIVVPLQCLPRLHPQTIRKR